ncbi:Superoxide dismutase [Mn] [bacterium HR21]|nr:Superoxide dismutase [Mn] [bacterium HR21]
MERREFLGLLSLLGTVGATRWAAQQGQHEALSGALTEHKLPPLPYPYDALEPYIDAKTMELHHSKHHQAYVDGLNRAERELARARATGDFTYVEYWSKKAAFNAGGHFLHTLFWNIMAPPGKGGGGEPTGLLRQLIERDFGSVDAFRRHFAAAALAVEGSGWALLHYRLADGRLLVLQAENQHKLAPWGTVPILGLDVWEHAYYLKYQNRRKDYIDAWWNVVNWAQVQENLQAVMGK